ncbi:acyltransferase family protein [Flavobacterium ajazii]|uniref:acyltransferase family protein n=1 Tax=Flavobacterium ajazii TaxID=2692318 RepID=UPI0013D6E5BC|nr:acyltransferase [Flavobacterium ajazii]
MIVADKYNWVNALRGYAILLVILIHSSQSFKISDLGSKFYGNGDLGVQLFFILSSFTLYNSYSKRRLEEGELTNRNFFIRRFFRIAPYYYIAGLIYIFYKIVIKHNTINFKNLIANYTFTNGIYLPGINDIPPGGWSIGIEMLFYLLIPTLFKYINSLGKAIGLFLITALFSIAINHYFLDFTMFLLNSVFESINKWSLYFWLPNQLPIFILGIILYYINKSIILSFSAGRIILIVSIFLYFGCSFFDFSLKYPFYFMKKEYIYGIIFVLFAIGTYTINNKFIINDFVQKIGVVSFSMYLNHFLIISVLSYVLKGLYKKYLDFYFPLDNILQSNIVFGCFYFLIIIITYWISKVTYRFIEIKGIALGEKITK